jgi:hypothetical protein
MAEQLHIKVPVFHGDGPFGAPATGPFSLMELAGKPPSVSVGMTVQTGAQETKPFHLLLSGQHIAELAMVLLEFAHNKGIPFPPKPGAKAGWQTAIAEDGSKIRLRILQTSGLQVDLDMIPGDAMKLRNEMDEVCKRWRSEFAKH